ncbi:telomerase reverse transcriptase [Indicator indicator]|uniref:telomerase reverse transcriptase n=1 Tax=Indicator indicator TaxID=1002788 RepID=UPI0023DEE8E9|nr:telomerase reverse transcriptase [Indicator indicator]
MAGAEPFAAVLGALRGCYAEVTPLETFIRQLQESNAGEAELLRGDDTSCYRTFVSHCVVCVPCGARAIPRPFTFQQLSGQDEVIARVIQRLCEKRKKNILAYGYSLLDENSSHFPIMPFSRVYSYLPNTVTETMRMSGLWQTLMSRIGDDVTMYLLEHCAIFMLVPPSNCYQVCGQPVYELISHTVNVDSSPVFAKQRFSKRKRSSLLDYIKKRLRFHRQYLSMSHGWKCRQRLEANVSSLRNTKPNMSSCHYAAKDASKADEQIRMGTEHLEEQSGSSSRLSATAPSLKRKPDREQLEIPAKRAKVEEKARDESADSVTADVKQSNCKSYGAGCVASRSVCPIKKVHVSQSKSDMSGPSLVHTSHNGKKCVAGERSFLQGVQSNKCSKSSIEKQAESHRKGVEMNTHESHLDSVRIKPMEGISSKYRMQENPVAHLAKKSPNRLSRSEVYIDRKLILYSRKGFKECFSKSFLLNRLQHCKAGGRLLVEAIFLNQNVLEQKHHQSLPDNKWRKKRLPKRYWQMRCVFQALLRNHRRCPYLVLLKKNCPVCISETKSRKTELPCQTGLPGEVEVRNKAEPCGKEPKCVTSSSNADVPDNLPVSLTKSAHGESQSEEQDQGEASDSDLGHLIKQRSNRWHVYLFVRECLEKVIPAELWGSNHNKCRFLKNVKVFISMGMFAKLSLQELTWKMRVNDCLWLRLVKGDHFVPASEHRLREEILAKFLYWLMRTYVVELLRSFFYVTESMSQKNNLHYYRKRIWGKLQNIGIRSHIAKVPLRALSLEEVKAIRQKKCIPVVSKLRFIPKTQGLRPIIKVSSVIEPQALSKESREKKMHHYNTQLKNLFSVLNYERTINTSFIGSSAFGKDDIYRTWKKFVTKVHESDGETPHFYFVKTDVSRAYDTIPHKKLVEVISQILKPEKRTVYCIRRYAVIMITTSGKARKFYKRHVSTFMDFLPDMEQFLSHLQENDSLQDAIVVEQSLTFNETSSTLFEFFLQMLHNIILKIKRRYYLQCCGIPQGSILSTLLCNLCYGDMENKLLPGIQQDGVLIRLIDDFLLVTPHLTKAKAFLRTLAVGIPEYGFSINHKKTVVNFPVDGIPGCSEFKQVPGDHFILWCGLSLDIRTLEVSCDYSSYNSTSIRTSLSFNSSTTAGKNMKYKLITVLKLKCHGLFLDLQINSLQTVLLNVYKIFLLQACRFHACVHQLPFNQKVRNNPDFFLRIISDTASCCYSTLKAKNAGVVLGNKGVSDMFPSGAAEWLCYHAFTVKLSKYTIIYKCLLKPLKICKMQLLRNIPKDTMALLKTVTEPSLCEDFTHILK